MRRKSSSEIDNALEQHTLEERLRVLRELTEVFKRVFGDIPSMRLWCADVSPLSWSSEHEVIADGVYAVDEPLTPLIVRYEPWKARWYRRYCILLVKPDELPSGCKVCEHGIWAFIFVMRRKVVVDYSGADEAVVKAAEKLRQIVLQVLPRVCRD